MRYLFLLLLFGCLEQPPQVQPTAFLLEKEVVFQDTNYIVMTSVEPEKVLKTHGIKSQRKYNRLKGFSARLNYGQLKKLKSDPNVKYIELDGVAKIQQTITDKRRIGASTSVVSTSDSLVALILDTGIDPNHPDLHVLGSADFTGEGDFDGHGHGSHVGGIIGAKGLGVYGVFPNYPLVSFKVLNSMGWGNFSWILSALDSAKSFSSKISSINLSLGAGGYYSQTIVDAFQSLVDDGVIICVAAGNANKDVLGLDGLSGTMDDFFPASAPNVITVSSMCDVDGLPGGLGGLGIFAPDDQFDSFSNYSQTRGSKPFGSSGVTLAAPGDGIYSTFKDGGYKISSGTSMACPHVVGSVALRIAIKGKPKSSEEVYSFIRQMLYEGEPQPWTKASDKDANWEPLVNVRAFGDAELLPPNPSNTSPVLRILSPVDKSWQYSNVPVFFQAEVVDDQDLTNYVDWYNGSVRLNHGSPCIFKLYAGNYTILCTVVDRDNHRASDTVSFSILQNPNDSLPKVTILTPGARDTTVLGGGDSVSFSYHFRYTSQALDREEGDLTSKIVWTYNGSPIAYGGIAPLRFTASASLEKVTFNILSTVTDSSMGRGFDTSTITVLNPLFHKDTVIPPPPPPPVDTTKPLAPSGLEGIRLNSTTIVLNWVDNSTNEDEFVVYKQWKVKNSWQTQTKVLLKDTEEYQDNEATRSTGSGIKYQIWARNKYGTTFSNTITVK